MRSALRPLLRPGLRRIPPVGLLWRQLGRRAELRFWERALAERPLRGEEKEWLFTEAVGLEPAFYVGKRILDVGCGPRRELAWADHAASRVGLDPLAERYRELVGDRGDMDLVAGTGESMPFPDESFDVVSSLNSLDHVDDVLRVASEVKRVLSPGGVFVLITDVGHRARLTEPQVFSWDVVDLFGPELRLTYHRRYRDTGRGISESVADAEELPDDELGPGVLVARFEKAERGEARVPTRVGWRMTERGTSGPAPLLVVGPTTPPFHGGAVMTERLLTVLRDRDLVADRLDTRDSRSLAGIGRFDARNVWLGVRHALQLVVLLARHPGAGVYVPISQARWGFVRDSVLLLSARAARRRRIVHLHGGHFHTFYRDSGVAMRALIRVALAGVDQAWVLTEGLRSMFDGLVPPDRVRVLANSVDDPGVVDEASVEGPPEDTGPLKVLHVSNLVRAKGWEQLFAAAERLSARSSARLHLRLVGEVPERTQREIQHRAERLVRTGVEVEVLGTLVAGAKAAQYHWADVFVYPSIYRYDGQPLVLLEAMASGLPIITSSIGGIPDTVSDGETAVVIAPGDVDGLARSIERVAEDGSLRRRLGVAARRRYLARHTPSAFAASVDALLGIDEPDDGATAKPPPQGRRARPRPPTPRRRRFLRT